MSLSESKARLLARRLKGDRTSTAQKTTIPPAPIGQERILSPAQQRIWYLNEANPESPLFNVLNCFWFKGIIDSERLQQAARTVLQRHQILRSTYHSSEDNVTLTLQPAESFQLETFRHPHAEISSAAKTETNRPFRLSEELPLRLLLFQATDDERHLIVLITHDLVFDKWSLGLFWKELSLAYQEQSAQLTPLPIQYCDFSFWQQSFQKTDSYQQQLRSWSERLRNAPPILEIPGDCPPPITRSDAGQLAIRQISPELTEQLRKLAASCDVSLFTLILTAFKIFLLRICRETEIIVGTPIANRRFPELSDLIGFFLNTSALRTDLSHNPTFLDALTRVRETVNHALENQDVIFDDLVRELNPPRQPGQHPFFSTMFIFQREQEAVPPIDIPGCNFEMTYLMADVSKVDLSLFAAERNGGLETIFEYRTDLFSPALMEKLLENFESLLQSITNAPSAKIETLDLSSPADRALYPRQEEPTPSPLFLERLENVVKTTPDHLALGGQSSLTYQELWTRSAGLAQALSEKGLHQQPIAILLPRSNEAIIAIVGILRSGNAYLPINPTIPDQRLQDLLSSGTPQAVVTDTTNIPRLDTALPLFEISEHLTGGNYEQELPSASDLAYLILTSGSTGQPKPVAISHSNLAHSTFARKSYYEHTPERYLLISSLAFDSSVAGLFWTLAEGGTLVPMPEGLEQDIEALANFIQVQGITHLLSLPSLYQLLLEHTAPEKLHALTTVIVAGESCPSLLAQTHHQKLPHCQLHNEYGPTEATVWATAHQVTADEQPVPIGKAIPQVQVHLLDSQHQPVPLGMLGELAISGPTLASGYYKNPALTEERFLAPTATRPRTYLTGDIARQNLDGTIYFLGRKDRQIKVRGFRIEPGEIESTLCLLPAISEAAVIAHEQQIHAFLLSETPPPQEQLVSHLRSRLPDYMVPATFQFIPSLPRLSNGKTDTLSLVPLIEKPSSDEVIISPRTPLEQKLAQVWSEVLNESDPSIEANFFESGGDSLSSIRFLAKARAQGIHLEASDLFQFPSISALASIASESQPNLESTQETPQSFPLSPIQRWFFDQEMPESAHWNLAFRSELRQPFSLEAISQAFTDLLSRHPILTAAFPTDSSEDKQHQIPSSPQKDLIQNFTVSSFDEITPKLQELHSSLVLDAKLVGLALFQNSAGKQAVVFWAHHLLVDPSSLNIIHEEFGQLLAQTPLPPVSTSFASHISTLERKAIEPETVSTLPFWIKTARYPFANLPTTTDSSPTEADLESYSFQWERELSSHMLSQANESVHTKTPELILASVCRALLTSSETTIRVLLEGHGRNPEVSESIGWFTTNYPCNFSLSSTEKVQDSLVEIKEQAREIPSEGESFGLLRYLNPDATVRDKLAELAPEHLLFNFLGTHLTPEPKEDNPLITYEPLFAHARSPQSPVAHPLEVISFLKEQKLHFILRFSPSSWSEAEIQNLANRISQQLDLIFDHCLSTQGSTFTPSDFPDADLDNQDLDELLGSFD